MEMLSNITIAIVGSYSSGKTTLVNALLCGTYSPVSYSPTTKTPQIYRVNKKSKSISPDKIYKKNDEINKKMKNFDDEEKVLDEIVHQVPWPKDFIELSPNVVKLDTLDIIDIPGLDGEDGELYHDYLEEKSSQIDIYIMVVNIECSFGRQDEINELEFIANLIKKNKYGTLYVLMNKCDRFEITCKKKNGDVDVHVDNGEQKDLYHQAFDVVSKKCQDINPYFGIMKARELYVYRTLEYGNKNSGILESEMDEFIIHNDGKKELKGKNYEDKIKHISSKIGKSNKNNYKGKSFSCGYEMFKNKLESIIENNHWKISMNNIKKSLGKLLSQNQDPILLKESKIIINNIIDIINEYKSGKMSNCASNDSCDNSNDIDTEVSIENDESIDEENLSSTQDLEIQQLEQNEDIIDRNFTDEDNEINNILTTINNYVNSQILNIIQYDNEIYETFQEDIIIDIIPEMESESEYSSTQSFPGKTVNGNEENEFPTIDDYDLMIKIVDDLITKSIKNKNTNILMKRLMEIRDGKLINGFKKRYTNNSFRKIYKNEMMTGNLLKISVENSKMDIGKLLDTLNYLVKFTKDFEYIITIMRFIIVEFDIFQKIHSEQYAQRLLTKAHFVKTQFLWSVYISELKGNKFYEKLFSSDDYDYDSEIYCCEKYEKMVEILEKINLIFESHFCEDDKKIKLDSEDTLCLKKSSTKSNKKQKKSDSSEKIKSVTP
jgi:predicted GTPase